jgi:hypothetical protein
LAQAPFLGECDSSSTIRRDLRQGPAHWRQATDPPVAGASQGAQHFTVERPPAAFRVGFGRPVSRCHRWRPRASAEALMTVGNGYAAGSRAATRQQYDCHAEQPSQSSMQASTERRMLLLADEMHSPWTRNSYGRSYASKSSIGQHSSHRAAFRRLAGGDVTSS